MEANQKILYEGFKKAAEEHKNPIIRERCKKAAAEILKSFPQFEKNEAPKHPEGITKSPKEEKPISKEDKSKKEK